MKMNRLFEIMYLLLKKRLVTAKELSDHFGVSSRTIYRDIDTLIASGVPIYTSKGKGGGIGLPESFPGQDPQVGAAGWCSLLESAGSLYENGTPDPLTLFSQFTALLCKDDAHWLHIDFTIPKKQCKETFTMLKSAILKKQQISFNYISPCGTKQILSAKPIRLCYRGIDWFVCCLGNSGQPLLHFKLNRICGLRNLEETFSPADQSSSPEYDCSEGMDVYHVQLRIDSVEAERVYDEYEQQRITKNPDGSFTVTATYPEERTMYSHIFSYGPNAVVLSPDPVRLEMQKQARILCSLYD